MARFIADDANKYGGQGGRGFFSIKKNHGTKQVRFMYNKVEDVEGMSVHKINIDGKDRYVNCLREYNDPISACPFCADSSIKKAEARLFVPIYSIDDDEVQIWDRGKTWFQKITSLCSRYGSKDNLVNHIFEIERNGEPNDMKTTYEIYPVDKDDTELSDLPEVTEVLGGFVLDKTAEDMNYYLEEGEFPPTDDDFKPVRPDDEDEAPVRRREQSNERAERRDTGRRTPATNRSRRNEDTF